MTRAPQEVFAHHGKALAAGDLDEIVADYADDSVVITSAGVARGKDGVRKVFVKLLDDLPNAVWDLKTQVLDGEVLFLEWAADSCFRGHRRNAERHAPVQQVGPRLRVAARTTPPA
jgi:ketosteroid isomerase-like protein